MMYDDLPSEIKSKIIYLGFGIYHDSRKIIKKNLSTWMMTQFCKKYMDTLIPIKERLDECSITGFETIEWLLTYPGIRYQIKHNDEDFLFFFCGEQTHYILGNIYHGDYDKYELVNLFGWILPPHFHVEYDNHYTYTYDYSATSDWTKSQLNF